MRLSMEMNQFQKQSADFLIYHESFARRNINIFLIIYFCELKMYSQILENLGY